MALRFGYIAVVPQSRPATCSRLQLAPKRWSDRRSLAPLHVPAHPRARRMGLGRPRTFLMLCSVASTRSSLLRPAPPLSPKSFPPPGTLVGQTAHGGDVSRQCVPSCAQEGSSV